MHELSLAQSLISQVIGFVAEHRASRVTRVTVVLGPFSGIVADSFSFGFNALKLEEEATRAAELELELPDPEYRCRQCGASACLPRETDAHPAGGARLLAELTCPHCGAQALSPHGGGDLVLKTIEME